MYIEFSLHLTTAVQLESAKQNAISKSLLQDSFRHIFRAMRKMHHTFWKKPPLEVPGFTISFVGVKFSLVLSFSIGTLYTISEFRMDVFWKSFLEENDTLFMDLSRFGVNKYEAINSHHTAARYTTYKEKWSYPS